MIKLELPVKPDRLTLEFQTAKTQEFLDTGKQVWNIDWLKEAVFNMAFGKCCYSEVKLGEESKNMEIEHFYPKSLYQDEVMSWGNLLPSLKKCNGKKRTLDTKNEPIINPFINNPKDFFYIKACRYYAKDANRIVAKRSIDKLDLNDRITFVNPRLDIFNGITNELVDRKIDFDIFQDILIPIGRIKRLMQTGNRKKEYSALVSTLILSDENYIAIEKLLIEKELWDAEFETLKSELIFCSLLPPLE